MFRTGPVWVRSTSMTSHIDLSPEPRSVARARRWVARTAPTVVDGSVDAVLVDTLALLVSEVVTNSVLHARTPCALSLRQVGDRLRVEVADGCSELPVKGRLSGLAEHGRGVGLVSTLSDAHGVHRSVDGGKTCWFELALPRSTSPDHVHSPPAVGQVAR